MAGIFDAEPPAWLQNSTSVDFFKSGQATGELLGKVAATAGTMASSRFQSEEQGQNFFQKVFDASRTASDPFYMEKAEAMRSQADLQSATTKDKIQGMKEYPEWLKSTGGDPDKILTTPFTGTSQSGSEQVTQAKQAAWMRSNQQRATEIKQQQIDNQLTEAEQKLKMANDRLAQTGRLSADRLAIQQQEADASTTRAGADASRAKTAADKAQFLKSGSLIYRVNPDTQELEPVDIPNKGLAPKDAIGLLEKKASAQAKLDAVTDPAGAGKKSAAAFQATIDAIDKQLSGVSDGGSSDQRVRVKGPNGEKGTVKKGTALPKGWSLE